MTIQKIMDKAKTINNLRGDSELARLIGVSQNAVWNWRQSRTIPSPENAQHLAELAGIDPAPFVAEMLIAGTKDDALKRTIERLKKACAALSVSLVGIAVQLEAATKCILCKIDTIYSVMGSRSVRTLRTARRACATVG
jgi:transcriptional regulator with XRE-family HTH domain